MRLGMVRHFGRFCVLLVAGLAATFAFGQNANTGEIKGTAQDSDGREVSRASKSQSPTSRPA